MTTTLPVPDAATTEAADTGVSGGSLRRPLSLIGGAALLVTPLLVVGGILTSPPQETRAMDSYIESLARDPFLSAVSASLLHYGWITMALGLVVAMTLVRGRRGRVLALLGGLGGAFAAVQMSGVLLNDWFLVALGRNLAMPEAVEVADAVMGGGGLLAQVWFTSAQLSMLLPVLLYAGLARAGVISWWLVPLSLFPMVAPYLVMGLGGGAGDVVGRSALGLVAAGLTGLVCYAPTFLTGLRLINRGRLTDRG